MTPDPVDLAQLRRMIKIGGYARATFGVAMLVVPGFVANGWIGADREHGGVKALTRALGIRDLLLGAGAILAANERRDLRRWVEFGMVADATDAVATVLAGRSIPAAKAALAFLVAGGGAAAGGWTLTQLPEEVTSTA